MKHCLINLTWACHNSCVYCWVEQTVRTRSEMIRVATRPLEQWVATIKRDKPDVVDIAGGEPLLVPWVVPLVRACPEVRFGLSTNGLAMGVIEQLVKERTHLQNLIGINLSYHPNTNCANYILRWRHAVNALRGAGYVVGPNVVDFADNVERSRHAIAWMEGQNIPYAISPYEDCTAVDTNTCQNKGLICQGGINHLNVAPDGTAWPCLSSMRSSNYQDYVLGNWLDGTVDVSRKPQPCYLWCHDYYVLKEHHQAGDMWGIDARLVEESYVKK